MHVLRTAAAAALIAVSATAAWPQKPYCEREFCAKAWTGQGWYAVYGETFGQLMVAAGPFADRDSCQVEADQLAKKYPKMVSIPQPNSNRVVIVGKFSCRILESAEEINYM